MGKYLRATASYDDAGGSGKSVSVASTAQVVAKPACASYSDISNTEIGGDATVRSGWSDGRAMFVGLFKNVSADTSLSNPVRAFNLCSGERLTALGERYAKLAGGANAQVVGMWAEGPTMWISNSDINVGDQDVLHGFSMHPALGWVHDSDNSHATGINNKIHDVWSNGPVLWVGLLALPRNNIVYFAFDWANRTPGAALSRIGSLDIRWSDVTDRTDGGDIVYISITSDGDYIYIGVGNPAQSAAATTIPSSSHRATSVPVKDIAFVPAVSYVQGMWSDGERIWLMSFNEDGDANDPRTKVFVQTIPNGGPSFADSDNDGADPVSLSVPENAGSGIAVGTVVAATIDLGAETRSDPEGDAITYSVGGTDLAAFNADFSLDAATGEITVRTGATLDYETTTSYAVTISVTDSKDAVGDAETTATADDTVEVTIKVTNVDDPGAVSLSTAMPLAGVGVTATLTDPDGGITGTMWQWSISDTAGGTFTDISGVQAASYTPLSDDLGKFLKATASYTDTQGPNKRAEKEADSAVANPPPAFPDADDDGTADPISLTVAENASDGDAVGTAGAADPDGDTLTYSVSGTDLAAFNEDFSLNTSTGAITVKTGATLDYETRTSYAVTISVTDSKDAAGDTETPATI